jgi:hypothetical protein
LTLSISAFLRLGSIARQFVLQGEYVFQHVVVALRPQMRAAVPLVPGGRSPLERAKGPAWSRCG